MTPTSIKQYLQRRGVAPMVDLVNRFDSDPAAVGAILDFWIRKGRVRRIAAVSSDCGSGCSGCADSVCSLPETEGYNMVDLFEWLPKDGQSGHVLALDALERLTGDVHEVQRPTARHH